MTNERQEPCSIPDISSIRAVYRLARSSIGVAQTIDCDHETANLEIERLSECDGGRQRKGRGMEDRAAYGIDSLSNCSAQNKNLGRQWRTPPRRL